MSTESSLDMVFLTLSWMGSLVLRGLERGHLLFTKLTVTEKPRWSSLLELMKEAPLEKATYHFLF